MGALLVAVSGIRGRYVFGGVCDNMSASVEVVEDSSRSDKVTPELAARLDDAGDELVDVVVELATPEAVERTEGARSDRVAVMKESFGREAQSVESVIRGSGGQVVDTAWLNQTIRAKVPVEAVRRLCDVDSVAVVDSPRGLEPETD